MTFPRNPKDNSLDWVAFEKLDEDKQDAALLDLKTHGTAEEHKQAKQYFSDQEIKCQNSKIQAQQNMQNLTNERNRLNAENTQLNVEKICLERQKVVIHSKLSSAIHKDLTTVSVSNSTPKDSNGCNIF